MRLLNESVACLREHVVANADLLDGGIIFGTGFAPFRGGPVHYVRESGVGGMRETLQQLTSAYGTRFQPDDGWASL